MSFRPSEKGRTISCTEAPSTFENTTIAGHVGIVFEENSGGVNT